MSCDQSPLVGIDGTSTPRLRINHERALVAAKRRQFDVLVCWRLDRLGRNLRHLVTLIEDLNALGIAFVSLGEGIDCTTRAGKLQLHILAAPAEFERARFRNESEQVWHGGGRKVSGLDDHHDESTLNGLLARAGCHRGKR